MIRYRGPSDDRGVTLVELMVASFGSLIIGAVMLSWLINVSQADEYEQQASIALEEMRTAKSRLVKDIRFADDLLDTTELNAHTVRLIIGADAVVWTFEADGTLTRTLNGVPSLHASRLVYDAAKGPGSSRFIYDQLTDPTHLTIELVADIEATQGPDPKQIRTDVHLRNV